MSHINFICEIAHAYQHMPAYFHYITQNHAYLPTHTRTWVPMMAQWPPLMRGHPFWEATFTQHLGWLLVRGFTVCKNRDVRVLYLNNHSCINTVPNYFNFKCLPPCFHRSMQRMGFTFCIGWSLATHLPMGDVRFGVPMVQCCVIGVLLMPWGRDSWDDGRSDKIPMVRIWARIQYNDVLPVQEIPLWG